jgi:hypothetical protein
MEEPVNDVVSRWLTGILLLMLFIPVAIFLLWLRTIDHRSVGDLLTAVAFIALLNAGLFLFLHVVTNVWIQIDPPQRRVSQLYKFFGWTVYRKTFDLSQFDHISVHRVFRGGYRATLVGREREVPVAASWKLGTARRAAERAAAFTSLRLSDQL